MSRNLNIVLAVVLGSAGVSLGGCKVATQTDLRFSADPESRARAVTLRVEVRDGRTGDVLLLDERPVAGGRAIPWPSVLPLTPEGERAQFSMVAELLETSRNVFSVQRRRSNFRDREHRVIDVIFSDPCIGVMCAADTTCRDGSCVSSWVPLDPDEHHHEDNQAGAQVRGSLFWEHPRPTAATFRGSCIGVDPRGEPILELAVGAGGEIFRRSADTWTQEELAMDTPMSFHAVACWGAEAIAVSSTGHVVTRDVAGEWRIEDTGISFLSSVSGASADQAWIGGGGGIARRTAAGWERVSDAPEGTQLWSPSTDEVWTLSEGSLFHYEDGAWSTFPPPSGVSVMRSLAGRGSGELWVVGDDHAVYSDAGDGWRRELVVEDDGVFQLEHVATGEDGTVVAYSALAVHVRTATGEWARSELSCGVLNEDHGTVSVAGARGVAVGRGGCLSTWSLNGPPDMMSVRLTTQSLLAIARMPTNPSLAVAVGESGTALTRTSAGTWRHLPSVSVADLTAVTSFGGTWITVAGSETLSANGLIAERVEGEDFRPVFTREGLSLYALAASASRVVAVGDDGTVLERGPSGTWADFETPLPGSVSLRAATWDGNDLLVGASNGEVWRYDGSWALWYTAEGSVSCLRPEGGAVFVCHGNLVTRILSGVDEIAFTAPDVVRVRDVAFTAEGGLFVAVLDDIFLHHFRDTELLRLRPQGMLNLRGMASTAVDILFVGGDGAIVRLAL